jgi:cytochrome c
MMRGVVALLSLAVLSSAAGADDGAAFFGPCRACHALDPAANVMAGPNLAGLIGRKVAGDDQFDYSPVLRQARQEGRVWSADTLEKFIADPEAVFPGTWMSRVPIGTAAERKALVAFLADPNSR